MRRDTVLTAEEQVRALAEEVIAGSPLYLVEVSVRGARGSQVVEVFIDSDEGLGVDDLAAFSRELGFLLDTEDVLPSKYNLNVSSPGLDRPLTMPRQYRKNVGRELVVKHQSDEAETPVVIDGTLASADDEAFELAVSEAETRRIRYEDALEARIRLPW